MNLRARGLVALALAGAVTPVWSQKPVYRCKQAGRVIYTDSPCKAGVAVEAADPRTDAERRSAQEQVDREQRMSERMARERRAAEADASRRGPAHIRHAAADQAASAPTRGDERHKAARKPAKVPRKPAPAAPAAPAKPGTPGAPLQR